VAVPDGVRQTDPLTGLRDAGPLSSSPATSGGWRDGGRLMRRAFAFLGAIAAMVLAAGVLAAPASAYGGGAAHDMWQVGLSFNCDNPDYCGPDLGGFWGWVEFDRAGTTTWGDAALAGCGHTVGGGGPGT